MAVVAYVRHGQREPDSRGAFRGEGAGTLQCGITEEGIRQAHRVGKELTKLTVAMLFSSPLQMARETADIIKDEYFSARGSLRVELDESLIERQVGRLSNRPMPGDAGWIEFRNAQARANYPDIESFISIKHRVVVFSNKIARRHDAELGVIVAVTHQDVIHAAVGLAYGYNELNGHLNPGVDEGSLTVISYKPSKASVMLENKAELSKADVNMLSQLLRA